MSCKFGVSLFTKSVAVLPGLVCAQLASASDDIFDLSLQQLLAISVVTAASGFEQNIQDAPASVTVIKAAEWQSRGAQNLTEALRGAPGLGISMVQVGPTRSQYVIRGLAGDFGQQVKLLIDGVPANRIWDGGTMYPQELPLLGFKRIEIIRSPGSAVYGADAFAGIINLVSYDIGEQPSSLKVVGGDFDSYNLGLTQTWIGDELGLQMALNYHRYGEDPDRIIDSDLQTSFDQVFATNASLAPGAMNTAYEILSFKSQLQWRQLDVDYYGLMSEFGFGAGVAQALDPQGKGDHQHHSLQLEYDLSGFVSGQLSVRGWYQYKDNTFPYTIFPPGAVLPIGADGNANFSNPVGLTQFSDGYLGHPGGGGEQMHIDLTGVVEPAVGHSLHWSFGGRRAVLKTTEKKNFGPGVINGTEPTVDGELTDVTDSPYVYAKENTRDFTFLSVQDEWRITGSLIANIGARIDDYSDFGSTLNPRLGLNWSLSDDFQIRLFAGSAFRAPASIDLYARNNPASLGNGELNPEQIETLELGFDYIFSEHLHSSLTLYAYEASELIDFVANAQTGEAVVDNVGEQEARGVELELQWRPSERWDISANYSYLDSEDDAGNDTADVAGQMAALQVNWRPLVDLTVNLSSNWVMDRRRPEGDLRPQIDDYTWVTGRIVYSGWLAGAELALVGNNLLDDSGARESSTGAIAEDYPLMGRQLLLEGRFNF